MTSNPDSEGNPMDLTGYVFINNTGVAIDEYIFAAIRQAAAKGEALPAEIADIFVVTAVAPNRFAVDFA